MTGHYVQSANPPGFLDRKFLLKTKNRLAGLFSKVTLFAKVVKLLTGSAGNHRNIAAAPNSGPYASCDIWLQGAIDLPKTSQGPLLSR